MVTVESTFSGIFSNPHKIHFLEDGAGDRLCHLYEKKDMKNLSTCLLMLSIVLFMAACSEEIEKKEVVVLTDVPDDITFNEVTLGGEVVSEGESPVTRRGLCIGLDPNPSIDDNNDETVEEGQGLGKFGATYTGFDPSTTYHVRAFATNREGTFYGPDQSFTTLALPAFVVSTDVPSNVTATVVTVGGNVLSDGGSSILSRGIVFSLEANPTVDDQNDLALEIGTGLGAFSNTYDGLTPGTTYHVRAFAINNDGVAYGENRTFTTLSLPGCPIVNVTPNGSGITIASPTTWVKDKVYVITGNVNVTSTLTIEPGAVIKLSGARISVSNSGKILANGTSTEHIVFTSLFDDSYCGDTNNDGTATTPNKGDWTSLYLNGGTAHSFKYCDFLYAGKADGGYNNAVLLSVAGTSFEFDHCTFAHTLSSTNSTAFVFHGGSYMIDNTVSKFTNNVFYDNDRPLFISTYYNLGSTNVFHNPANPDEKNKRNGIWLYNTTNQGATITFSETEVPYVISAFFNGGGSGATDVVNVNANVILKFEGASAGISRSTSRNVTVDASAILTSIRDDARGGDTNGDGNASAAAAGDWDGFYNYATSSYITGANILFAAH